MRTLSARQQKILNFIRDFVEIQAFPPTVRDIVRGCGISSTSVADYNLAILEQEGYLKRHREVSRGIELLGETSKRCYPSGSGLRGVESGFGCEQKNVIA